MKNIINAHRDVLIFDCDGVFYSWSIYGNMDAAKNFCADIKADVVPNLFPHLSRDDAATMGKRSYEETGDGLRYFVDLARNYGIDAETFREQLHTAYHKLQLERVRMFHPEILSPCIETLQHLESLRGRVRIGMISQSCRDYWLTPVLTEKRVLSHIEPDFMYGFKQFGWNEKSISAKGLGIIMDAMDVDPKRVIFVEDTKNNLKPVREEFPDVLTVYVYDFNLPERDASYIDLQVRSNLDFLRQYSEAHQPKSALRYGHKPLELRL